ncbi:MAG: hypothetical protein AB7O67_07840 [Vicinamibacterales bacterium]
MRVARLALAALVLLPPPAVAGSAEGPYSVPVPGGTATLARLGIAPSEHGIAFYLLARAAEEPEGRTPVARLADPADDEASAPAEVWSPLSPRTWERVLPPLPGADLFTRLVRNRAALLVAAGASAAPVAVRALLEDDHTLLGALLTESPGAFVVAAPALSVTGEHVDLPGGPAATPAWEALAGAPATRPAAFIRALLARDRGRLAWFLSTMAALPAERLAALLPDGPADARVERLATLYQPFRDIDSRWRLEDHPFMRSAPDPAMVYALTPIRDGAAAPPAWRWLWTTLFNREGLDVRDARGVPRDDTAPVDIAWIAAAVAGADPFERRDRYDMLRFAQRTFGEATGGQGDDVLVALGGFRRYRALLLTLERMDVHDPSTYGAAVTAARAIDRAGRREREPALVAFQGALAIVERARLSRTLDAAAATQLVAALADGVTTGPSVTQAIGNWITGPLMDALPPLVVPDQWTARTAYESRILQALAGRPPDGPLPRLSWEGLDYHVDLHGAELQRIHTIRERLRSPGLDVALDTGRPGPLAEAIKAIVYAVALGDPEGPALLSPDVPERHDFNFTSPSAPRRERVPWLPPRDIAGDGGPWRVQGALVGLDLALARLWLHRVADGEMPAAPTINLNDQLTLARTVVALVPWDLRDVDRDAVVAAIARGTARIAVAGTDAAALAALAAEAGLSPATRESLPWLVATRPSAIDAQFTLRDRLWLGQPSLPDEVLARWGVFAGPLDGRLTTTMPGPAPWEWFAGRPEVGQIGAQVPDLILRLAQGTSELGLPARLIPALLGFAVQDFWHDVDARFADDWPAMSRQAAALPLIRIEDYVAGLAGNGPLR